LPVQRPVAPVALALVAVAAVGGPLALTGLYGPASVEDVIGASGWVVVAGAVAFASLVAIWVRYSRDVAGPAGLTGFVEAAAGRRVALAQAAVWTASYTLYLVYTGVYVVYDLLVVAVPSASGSRQALAVALPIAVAALLVAGRTPLLLVVGLIAAAQIVLAVALDVVSVVHAPTAAAWTAAPAADDAVSATAGVGGLFVCGSLPLFLGGEVRDAGRQLRRVLPAAVGVAAVLTLLAVYPYARHPAYLHAALPGMTVVDNESSHALAVAVGVGIAASVVGVMLIEGLALTRLLHAVSGRPPRMFAVVLAGLLVVAAPLSLLDPDRFYDDLLRPSLVLLWLAQLIVIVVFPRFVARRGGSLLRWLPVTLVAAATSGYELWAAIRGGGST
jgi:hypothetical protein